MADEASAGRQKNGNSALYYGGAMSILKPLIDSGTLVVRSGQVAMKDITTLRWSADFAHARLDNLLGAFYSQRHLDGVLAPNDEVAGGIIASLESAGYGRGSATMATVTGQDCEIRSMRAIIHGQQYSSVFKDTRKLAEVAAEMVAASLTDKPVAVNDTSGYNKGTKHVPAYVLSPAIVYKGTIGEQLIRSGYYASSQID